MKALVVGGEACFVRDVLTKHLSTFNIEVFSIWDWDHTKPIAKIPSECDCVIVVKDMTSHNQRNVARQLAKRQGVMFIEIPRKWSVAQKHLEALDLIPTDKDTSTHVQGEDFAATFARVVECSYRMVKSTEVRPKANQVSEVVGIPTWHLAMQKGISTGVAKANGEQFNAAMVSEQGWNLKEMVEMCLNDYPEMIRDKRKLSLFLSDLCGKKNNRSFQKRVGTISKQLRTRWVRSSRKANTHPDRIYIDGLKLKWFEEFARTFYGENKGFPDYSKVNTNAKLVFESQLTKTIYNTVVESLTTELEGSPPEPEKIARSEKVLKEPKETRKVETPPMVVTPTTVEDDLIPAIVHTGKGRTHGKLVKSKAMRLALEQHLDKLGTMHDDDVGALAGCSGTTVRRFRMEMGIAPYKKTDVSKPVLELKDFSNTDPDPKRLIDSVESLKGSNLLVLESLRELVVKVVVLERTILEKDRRIEDLTSALGKVKRQTPPNPESLGSKVDGLLKAGFKVKLEVTTE